MLEVVECMVDKVVCSSAFWQFPKPKETLQGIAGILSDSGICIFNLPQQFFEMNENSHRDAFVKKIFEELEKNNIFPKRMLKNKYTEAEIKFLVEESGMQLSKIEYVEFQGKSAEDSEVFLKISAVAPFFDGVPESVRERILRKVRNELEKEGVQSPKSKWAYVILKKD